MKSSYRVLMPIMFGGRREKGEIVEMTEEDAAAFGERYLEQVKSLGDNSGQANEPEQGGELTAEKVAGLKRVAVVEALTARKIEFKDDAKLPDLKELLVKSLGDNSGQ